MSGAQLVYPCEEYLGRYLEFCREFKSNNLHAFTLDDPDAFEAWRHIIFKRCEEERNGINLKEGYVPASSFWFVEDDELIGIGSIRHQLTSELERFGGHIGYAIRIAKWHQGYGTLQLKHLLYEAAKLGINKVLVTCDADNIASARVMEKNGAQYWDTIENVIEGKPRKTKRYYIQLALPT